MLNAVGGVLRGIVQNRSKGPDRSPTGPSRHATARRLHRRTIGFARILADSLTATPRARERAASAHAHLRDAVSLHGRHATARRRLYRRNLLIRATSDRVLPIAIALIVVLAAGVSLAPGAATVGAAEGAGQAAAGARLAVGGGPRDFAALDESDLSAGLASVPQPVDDGTLYKPVAVDTSVQTSAGMLQRYTVKDGDTLTSVASRFGVSMMTIWWANNLTSQDAPKVGSTLVIPPVSGLVVTVKVGDTLESLAKANKVSSADITSINELQDTNLIVGQVLVLPGAKGDPMPTPKPTPAATPKPRSGGGTGSGGTGGGSVGASGGAWAWPVPGGYVSQYFKYGHYGLDIPNDYGSAVLSPQAGNVVFAGWKNNGGGYQVWIYHGNNIYSMSAHMSSVSVSTGQSVSRGQRVGRVGSSGWSTGPHDHFSVTIGFPWESGSYFVNPLRYY